MTCEHPRPPGNDLCETCENAQAALVNSVFTGHPRPTNNHEGTEMSEDTKPGTATYVMDKPGAGRGSVYRIDPPMEGHDHVWVSAVDYGSGYYRALETYIFPCDGDGVVDDWGALEGSQRGFAGIERVLTDLGYVIV